MTSKQVAKKESTEIAPDYLKNTGLARGNEDVAQEDLLIPRLEIVQSLSPCKDKAEAGYIEGAEEGMLYNTVSRELYGKQVRVIPVMFRKEYLVFIDRKAGGGFRGSFKFRDEAVEQASVVAAEIDKKVEVVDAGVHFCLIGRKNQPLEQIAIVCTKTKLKVSRQWNSVILMGKGDRFSRTYGIEAVGEKNANGDKYLNFRIQSLGWPEEEEYNTAGALWKSLQTTNVGTTYEDENVPTEEGESKEF